MVPPVVYSLIKYSTVQYSTVQYNIVQFSTIQYNIVQYSSRVQYSIVHYCILRGRIKGTARAIFIIQHGTSKDCTVCLSAKAVDNNKQIL